MAHVSDELRTLAKKVGKLEDDLERASYRNDVTMKTLKAVEDYFIRQGVDEWDESEEGMLLHQITQWLYS